MSKALKRFIASADKLSLWALALSAVSIMVIMVIEVINALGRKFAMPLPCTLEAAESLMISCIFFAAPRVASLEDHTYITMLTRRLPQYLTRSMDAFGNFLGGAVTSVLAYGAWIIALEAIVRLEMRIGVFRFPLWPFRIMFALGLTLLAVQMICNGVRCVLQVRENSYPSEG
ncbi:MAG: TRAP transporter small permease [Desulfarculus sp.]|jgi:TRAP-type C4-dicarboxylate transport system permease small subunit|nr:MAG: TRAP transporter small permease [Desulfarculus sp.]